MLDSFPSCNFVRILLRADINTLNCQSRSSDLICEKSHDSLSSETFNFPVISFVVILFFFARTRKRNLIVNKSTLMLTLQ